MDLWIGIPQVLDSFVTGDDVDPIASLQPSGHGQHFFGGQVEGMKCQAEGGVLEEE